MSEIRCKQCGAIHDKNEKTFTCEFCGKYNDFSVESTKDVLYHSPISNTTMTGPITDSVVQEKWKSVLSILTESGQGSGFIVSDKGHVVTNSHVADIGTEIIKGMMGRTSEVVKLKLIADYRPSHNIDLSLLQIIDYDKNVIPFRFEEEENISEGQNVTVIGNGSGLGLALCRGTIARLNYNGKIQFNMVTNGGNSGSPIFNNRGNVVGILTNSIKDYDGMDFGVTAKTAKTLINTTIKL